MKRLLTLLLAAAMLLCVFTGCAGKEEPAESSAPAEESAPAAVESAPAEESAPEEAPAEGEEAPAEEEAENTYIGLDAAMEQRVSYDLPICTNDEVYTVFETTADSSTAIQTKYPTLWYEMVGLNMEFTSVPNSVASEKLNLTIAAETYYDIMPTSTGGLFATIDVAVEDEVLWDFAPYLEEYMPNYNMLIHSDPQYEANSFSDNGALTNLMQFYHTPYTSDYGPMIRQDMLDGVGLETPVTFDDWDEVLRAVKDEYDLDAAMILSQSGVGRNNYFCAGYGIAGEVGLSPMLNIPLYIENETVYYGAIADAFYDYLKMVSTWYADGIIYQDYYTMTGWSPDNKPIYAGETFVWCDDNRTIDTYQYNLTDKFGDAVVWPVTDPVLEEGSTKVLASSIRVSEGGCYLSTTLLDKDWETFLRCCDYAYSEDSDYLLTYGIEGEGFEFDENGDPQYTELITNNPEGYSMADAKTLYTPISLCGGVLFNEASKIMYSDAYNACGEKWDRSWGEIISMPMDATMNAEESETYSTLITDIATYSGEMITKFIVGEADLDAEWDNYVETVRSLRLDEALACQQAAYDRYIGRG
ncbi:MAG: hypothetical protein E7430_04330 [Ruminococcaceae bacterium]|nr:hypothetical protein [Oscillospiraceae bacterium]